MHLARDITILLVGLAIAGAVPRHASAQSESEPDSMQSESEPDAMPSEVEPDSAQSEDESDSDLAATSALSAALIEQRSLAQAGLGQGFMFRLLQSQLSIGDAENDGNVGKCKKLDQGGSVKLKRRIGTFVRQSTVDVYYDPLCKDVYSESLLTVDEQTKNHFAIVEA